MKPKIDLHVHMVGNGRAGSGCWLRTPWWRRPIHRQMVRGMGLPADTLDGDLEGDYARHLLGLVQASSIDAVVLLAQEQVYTPSGDLMREAGTFHVPNDLVLTLAATHPEFLAGVSIHPGRRDALDELDRCLDRGAALMKCLPNCQNIDCSDKRYTRFWERMAEARLPLLAHTGGEYTLQVINAAYSDPQRLELPLRCGVQVIAAHCATRSGLNDPQYFHVFTSMLERFPNLWGDNSAFLVYNDRGRGPVLPTTLQTPVAERILHGSDFPVPVSGLWAWARGFLSWQEFRKWGAESNLIERDYRWKRAIGYHEDTFTRSADILRLPRNWTAHRSPKSSTPRGQGPDLA